jgi:serine/threonine protein phosphatase PrpC
MTLELAGRTHIGLKRRENQDEVFAELVGSGDQPTACLAVADGMGGHEKGREASQTAIRTIRDRLNRLVEAEGLRPTEEWCRTLETAAHEMVHAISQGDQVTGTTLTVALLFGDECLIGHVGDSRAYTFRKGRLEQITEDQTWEAYALKHNTVNSYGKALRQAVGVGDSVIPEVYRLEVAPDDLLLLCSDGLYKMADPEQIELVLRQSRDATDACERLLNLALEGGGKDNVAVCVARVLDPSNPGKGALPPSLKLDPPLVAAFLALLLIGALLFLTLTYKI